MNKDQIQTALRNDTVKFTFTKANGESRNMQATLNVNFIPLDQIPVIKKDAPVAKENVNIVRCFDVDIKGWRSFRVDSLTEFNGNPVTQA
jgi:hypothetical protein